MRLRSEAVPWRSVNGEEGLNAVITRVGHVDRVVWSQRDALGRTELPREGTPASPCAKELMRRRKHLNTIVAGVCDVYVTSRINRHATRSAELPQFATPCSPCADGLPAWRELINTIIAGICNVEVIPRVNRDGAGIEQLARQWTERAVLCDYPSRRGQSQYCAVGCIRKIDVAVCPYCHAPWKEWTHRSARRDGLSAKTPAHVPFTEYCACRRETLDSVNSRIQNVEIASRVQRHTGGILELARLGAR